MSNKIVGFLLGSIIIFSPLKLTASELCKEYYNIYDSANLELAKILSNGILDDSAPREAVRQIEILNQRTLQMITLQQMIFYKCDLPKKPSSEIDYFLPAIECWTEKTDGNDDSPKCDTSTWESIFESKEHFRR